MLNGLRQLWTKLPRHGDGLDRPAGLAMVWTNKTPEGEEVRYGKRDSILISRDQWKTQHADRLRSSESWLLG